MDINTLLETLTDAIANDEATKTWCKVTYGRNHKVYVNVDVQDQPGENDCPYTAIYPTDKLAGHYTEMKTHGFDVICIIHDNESETLVEANIIQYKGVNRVEDFRKLVETAIAGANIGNLIIERIDIKYDTINLFPFMMAGMNISIREDHLLGSDPLE